MANEFEQPHPIPAAPAIATFDGSDFLQGNSYITFKGGVLIPSSQTFESYKTGDDTDVTITSTTWAAQTFTVGNTGSNERFFPVKIRLKSGNLDNDRIIIEIQEVTAGEPNGIVKVRFDGVTNKVIEGGSEDWVELDFSSIDKELQPLQASTQYALVVKSPVVTDTVRKDDDDGTYTGGELLTTVDSGSNWTVQTGDDMIFEIIGSTTNPYILSSANSFTSNILSTAFDLSVLSTDIDTVALSISFENEFNISAILDGIALLDFAYTETNADDTLGTAEIFHVRGATEISIGSSEGLLNDLTPNLQINLTKTSIIAGDKIKLKLTVGYIGPSVAVSGIIKHDPNTAGSEVNLQIPFKNNIN